ncbi:helix-turn-helix domain-containing protein [Glycomyces sp. YM15]|uniref:helix-turn-helix domain-containing protein n=1 Tax=Glycomyces sp. YM15 TaxID=2800446 RepID=UPI0035ABF42D
MQLAVLLTVSAFGSRLSYPSPRLERCSFVRFRVYPTAPQRASLARAFGSARVVYNDAVAARKHARREGLTYPATAQSSKSPITEAKRTPERAWLGPCPPVAVSCHRRPSRESSPL